jgi:hypothetical protein
MDLNERKRFKVRSETDSQISFSAPISSSGDPDVYDFCHVIVTNDEKAVYNGKKLNITAYGVVDDYKNDKHMFWITCDKA